MSEKVKALSIHVVIIAEGDTEIEFYKKLVKQFSCRRCKVSYLNLKGAGSFKNCHSKFMRDIYQKEKNKNDQFIIFLCHDNDIFKYSRNKYLDWNLVIQKFNKLSNCS